MATVCTVLVRETLTTKTYWPVATNCLTGHPSWRLGNLQDKPHRRVEVGGEGYEVGNVLPANRRIAPPRGYTKMSKEETGHTASSAQQQAKAAAAMKTALQAQPEKAALVAGKLEGECRLQKNYFVALLLSSGKCVKHNRSRQLRINLFIKDERGPQ